MALGAVGVPILPPLRPVEPIVRRDVPAGVEREPSVVLGVPRDRQRLQPPAVEPDEVLLERVHAERVAHREV